METELNRIAELLEQLAEQSAPWERTRISAPPSFKFTDRHGRRVYATSRGADVDIMANAHGVESVIFDGTWPQCRRFMDRLFREDITARALAASAEGVPAEPTITWQPKWRGLSGAAGFVRGDDGESIQYRIAATIGHGAVAAFVLDGERLHRIAECADEDAAKALCEAWERAFIEATKEVQS